MSCNGCRVLRKGCSDACILRPCLQWIESPEAQGNATVFVAKFFGRAGLMSFINAVPEDQRASLFRSLLYEACGRTINPVTGAVGLLSSGNWSICQLAVEAVLNGVSLKPADSLAASLTSSSTKSKHQVRNALLGPFRQPSLRPPSAAAASCLDPRTSSSPIRKKMKCNNSADVHVSYVDESVANSTLAISSLTAEDEVCKFVAPLPVRSNERSIRMIQDHQVEQQEAELSSNGSGLDLTLNWGLQGMSRVRRNRDRVIAPIMCVGGLCTNSEESPISCELPNRSHWRRHELQLLQLLT